jgi:hypothetical protein
MMKTKELKELLKGCKIVDVDFGSFSGSVQRMTLETADGRMLLVESMGEGSYEGSVEHWIEVTDVKTLERLA